MASIVAIRDGLAANLGTISGLRAFSYMPDRVSVPAAIVGEVGIDFDLTFGRGLDQFAITVRVYVSKASDRAGQDKLDGYLAGSGASSIKAAIEADKTLGGAAQTLKVVAVTGYGVYEVGGVDYLGAEFSVVIYASGS